MDTQINKIYSPQDIEKKWYQVWEDKKCFRPRKGKQNKPYTVIMPPPNVTGILHMGHALDALAIDAMIRFKRMKGFETLWIPGMDHAGIATQMVVEKMLAKDQGKKRTDFSREEFIKLVWDWKEKYGGVILKQQKGLGISCDWDRFMFTMDDAANESVNKAFVDMYNQGLIYQANYIINWSPALQSAISDAEVDHQEVKGNFYYIKYFIKDSKDYLTVATTRPETLLGDTAVAVHPEDDRYKKYIGKKVILPVCGREVPVIGDSYVDREKGTGCLKVTPGHDFNDFEIGQRNKLPIINILHKDGTLNENTPENYQGLNVKKAREKIIKELQEKEELIKIEELIHQVGHCSRSDCIVEPMVSKQWFLNVQEMAKAAVTAVENDTTRYYPKTWENTFFSWLKEPKDWCISRQLWWGHQIPVFYCKDCQNTWASTSKETQCQKCSSENISQDPDVLDTWFSSGLWPLTTLGWPDKKRMEEKEFAKFFPTSTLITGYDIIFFWVARMMMMSLQIKNSVPFEKIYIHGIVRDKHGRKMSKSLGNGIDPLDVIEEHGADSLRFTLASGSGHNRHINLDPERIIGFRNFINKVWNAFRFIHPFLENAKSELPQLNELPHHDKWILHELNEVSKTVNNSLEEFRYDEACQSIYQFVYDKFCSWYIELSKKILYGDDLQIKTQRATILKYTFEKIMALMHPMTPFVTEEIWSILKDNSQDYLIQSEFPEYDSKFEFAEDAMWMERYIDVMKTVRNLRIQINLPPKKQIDLYLLTDNEEFKKYLQENETYIQELAQINTITYQNKNSERPTNTLLGATAYTEILVPLKGLIDIGAYKNKIQKDLNKILKESGKLEAKLQNPKFLDKAPDNVVQEVKGKLFEYQEKQKSLEKSLNSLN